MRYLTIPNFLTALRIVFSIGLLFADYRNLIFVGGFLLCGLTDVLDGFIARKLKCETAFGAKLDSVADFFMFCMILVTMVKQGQINKPVIGAVAFIFALRIANAILSGIKFKKISSIHTIANKVTGIALFFCPVAYPYLGNKLLILTGIFAVASAVEECLIFLMSKTVDLNRKSIFMKQ